MDKLTTWSIAMGFVLVVSASALAEPRAAGPAKMRELFAKADQNGDRQVTLEELKTVAPNMTPEKFMQLDRNHDGVLSAADRAQAGPGQFGPKQGADREHAAQKLREADANSDGKVSYDEVVAKKPGFPKEAFDRYDSNHDGLLSAEDRPASPRPQGAISAGPGRPGPRPGAAARGQFLQKMRAADTNSDGKVSWDEAHAAFPNMAQDYFQRLDRNGDGALSPEDRN
ncbi:MAG: hypothetical protein HY706_19225 [Candidatus Hydrogenedentes bacterium]|nr:hypothetical protein [Candidatus Hydrogenedentota bacterium]